MSSILEIVKTYLPQHEGLLPKWLLFISIVSIGNSIQAYSTLSNTSRMYPLNPSPKGHASAYPHPLAPNTTVTPLSSRTFGTWTLITSIVRLYAAYYVEDPKMYQLAFWTYVVAWGHFMSEWFIFKTTKFSLPLFFPVTVASGSLIWMWLQWGFYVK